MNVAPHVLLLIAASILACPSVRANGPLDKPQIRHGSPFGSAPPSPIFVLAQATQAGSAERKAEPAASPPAAQTLPQAPGGLPTRVELEAKFKKTLDNSVFVGRWCQVKDGKLGEGRDEKYTIQSATKIGEETWLITARVQFGQKDVLVPIPVQVKWAGDTPVISITNLGIPGLGSYTARVVVYDNAYAGTWSASDHGGLLNGIITRNETK